VKIAAVLLAAGEGRRMGQTKALLRLASGETFLARCAHVLRRPRVSELIVVLGHDFDRVRPEVPAGAQIVRNLRYSEGMLASVTAGIDAAEASGAEALLLHPVDHPGVTPETVEAVLDALLAGSVIAVPTHAGRRGHPAAFAAATWPTLRAAPRDEGARAVLARHPEWVTHVPGDRFATLGVNTPEDLDTLLRAMAEARPSTTADTRGRS
jgi:CTP:molybdopterin cytidylyltransferase MocA